MKAYEQFISKNDIEKLHENVVRILSEVGVIFENPRALELFKRNGARVEGNKVFIQRDMLEDAIKSAPEKFTIHSTTNGDANIGGGSMLAGGIGGNIYIQDNGEIRKMTNTDVINQFKLHDTSPVIDYNFFNMLMDYSGCTEEEIAFGGVAMSLKYSSKYHINSYVNTSGMNHDKVYDAVRKGVKLIKRFEGLEDKVVNMEGINPLSPLAFDFDPIEKIFANCHEGQAIWFTPCSMPLLTAPASIVGLLSTTTAEILAGLVLTQLIKPGTPVIFGNTSAATNMRTIQLSIGAPETTLISYATAALADYYKLPFRTGGALSDAKDFDAQAGAETMMLLYATLNCKPDYILHQCGVLGTFNVVSFEKIILDEEVISMVKRQLEGIDFSDEKLSFDEIKSVGPRGKFLRGRTPKMYREEFFMPSLFNKEDPNQWQNTGSKSLRDAAKEKVYERLSSYTAPERSQEQLKLLEQYIPPQYKKTI
ncbi:MAG: hypothetical protein HGA49_03835 [Eubacteriaceae bacterium]|nr:hypothetical protein [Eubacteriaceae bacterium]